MSRIRKKKRATGRAAQEEAPPRFGFGARLAALVLGTIVILFFLSWIWHSRWPHAVMTSLYSSSISASKYVGFAITDVSVEGRHYTNKKALFKALGVKANMPIFLFNPDKAHEKIIAMPWVENATIIRSLPNKILIQLVERKPIARLQNNKKTTVIDSKGEKLKAANPKQFATLPLIVGEAEPKQIRYLLALLHRHPLIDNTLKAAVRVGKRRWDFHLHPNILVRLPEKELQKSLTKLSILIQDKKILEREIKTVDLRFSDRIVIEPLTGAQPQ